jgi:hypothetical protein
MMWPMSKVFIMRVSNDDDIPRRSLAAFAVVRSRDSGRVVLMLG